MLSGNAKPDSWKILAIDARPFSFFLQRVAAAFSNTSARPWSWRTAGRDGTAGRRTGTTQTMQDRCRLLTRLQCEAGLAARMRESRLPRFAKGL